MQREITMTALAALTATVFGSAYAGNSAENDALAITGARIGITQAVTAAENHVGGKATRAEYERHKGRWVFDVEVVKDTKVMDVQVDPKSGGVIAATEDKVDHEHDRDDDN